jgi:hypothetical protein
MLALSHCVLLLAIYLAATLPAYAIIVSGHIPRYQNKGATCVYNTCSLTNWPHYQPDVTPNARGSVNLEWVAAKTSIQAWFFHANKMAGFFSCQSLRLLSARRRKQLKITWVKSFDSLNSICVWSKDFGSPVSDVSIRYTALPAVMTGYAH